MAKIVDRFDSIEDKVLKILRSREKLKEENLQLKNRLNDKSNRIKELENRLEELEVEFQDLKAANALLGSSEFKRETKFKINSLIKDIDHCINQLSV